MPNWYMYTFQNSCSPYADNLMSFHNFTFMMLLMITTVTIFMLINIIKSKYTNRFLLKNHNIEIIWTIVPMTVLMSICFPSLKSLYLIDELWNPSFFTVKAIGHQWYWSYEYPEFNNMEYDSYMNKSNNNNKSSSFRLLDVDNRMILPFKCPIRCLTSSVDVIHSWTIPCLGSKMDATPGRINQGNIFILRPGIYYGQCSEICGANHTNMPVSLESTKNKKFKEWMTLHI